ncbi:TPA: fimbrial protein [Citrobacter koseri]
MINRIKCSILLVTISLSFIPMSYSWAQGRATSQGQGSVKVQGSILETACAIDTGSREQTIEMQVSPINQVIKGEYDYKQPFSINLINCSINTMDSWKYVQVTFEGMTDGELFKIIGAAKGIGLQISDVKNNIVSPGQPLQGDELQSGKMRLDYFIKFIGNNQPLEAGEFYSTIRFYLSYY